MLGRMRGQNALEFAENPTNNARAKPPIKIEVDQVDSEYSEFGTPRRITSAVNEIVDKDSTDNSEYNRMANCGSQVDSDSSLKTSYICTSDMSSEKTDSSDDMDAQMILEQPISAQTVKEIEDKFMPKDP